MPVPKPKKDETREKFFTRCMGDSVMTKEFKDVKQRGGVCGTAWKKTKNVQYIDQVLTANFASRIERKNSSEYLVVPIIALVEGVHHGSGGAVFYPASEIQKSAENWNGVPLTLRHPVDNGGNPISARNEEVLKKYSVGTFENVRYEKGKLKGDGWIDILRLAKLSPETLEMLRHKKNLEVSTGLFTVSDEMKGTWNGEQFDGTVSQFNPDHLALLPDEKGACDFSAGCGVRNNNQCKVCINQKNKGGELNLDEDIIEFNQDGESIKLSKSIVINRLKQTGFKVNEISHSNINKQLRTMLGEMDKPGTAHFLREVFKNRFVFEKMTEGDSKLFQLEYSINKDDVVKIKGDPQEVVHKEEFVIANKGKDNFISLEQEGGQKMTKEEKIQSLIDNDRAPYTNEDRVYLEGLKDEGLDAIVVNTEKMQTYKCGCEQKKDDANIVDNKKATEEEKKEEVKKVENEKVTKVEDLLANATPELKEFVESGIKLNKEKKDKLVNSLLANKRNKFSKDQLEAKKIDELEYMCSLAAVEVDYSGKGGVQKEPEIKINERHEDGSGVPDMPTINWAEAVKTKKD